MKMKRFFRLSWSACSWLPWLRSSRVARRLLPRDSPAGGKEIDVSFEGGMLSCTGDTMTVALDANATTGYEVGQLDRGEAVKAVGDEYKAETSSDGKAGASGVHVHLAEGSGEATITLKYARSVRLPAPTRRWLSNRG